MNMRKEKHTQYCIEMDEGFGWDYCCSSSTLERAKELLRQCENNEAKYPCRLTRKSITMHIPIRGN